MMGHKDIAELLIANHAEINAKSTMGGSSPLETAELDCRLGLAEWLRQRGAVGGAFYECVGDHHGETTYLPGISVNKPVPLVQPQPPYTEEARKARIEGIVVLDVVIRMDGTVSSIRIPKGKGLGYGLDESAINTIATKWLCKPGIFKDSPVNVQHRIEVRFSLIESGNKRADQLVRELGGFPASISRLDPVEERRHAVYEGLRKIDDPIFPALINGLTDPDVNIRRGVALFLSAIGSTWYSQANKPMDIRPCLQALIAALQDHDGRVRELSPQALANIGSDAAAAVPALIRLLEEPSEGSRNCACIGLYGIGPAAKDALPSLLRSFSDTSADVRRFAARAFQMIQGGN
jgi:TonB family protein